MQTLGHTTLVRIRVGVKLRLVQGLEACVACWHAQGMQQKKLEGSNLLIARSLRTPAAAQLELIYMYLQITCCGLARHQLPTGRLLPWVRRQQAPHHRRRWQQRPHLCHPRPPEQRQYTLSPRLQQLKEQIAQRYSA